MGFILTNMEEVKVILGISSLIFKHLKLGDRPTITPEVLLDRHFAAW